MIWIVRSKEQVMTRSCALSVIHTLTSLLSKGDGTSARLGFAKRNRRSIFAEGDFFD
jgi:hypothetical protein